MTDEMWYLLEQQAKKITELSARINRQEKYHEELLNLIRTMEEE